MLYCILYSNLNICINKIYAYYMRIGTSIYLIDRVKLMPIINAIIDRDTDIDINEEEETSYNSGITQFKLIASHNSAPFRQKLKHCKAGYNSVYPNIVCIYTKRLIIDEFIYAFPDIITYTSKIPIAYTIPTPGRTTSSNSGISGSGPVSGNPLGLGQDPGQIIIDRLNIHISSNTLYLPKYMSFICNKPNDKYDNSMNIIYMIIIFIIIFCCLACLKRIDKRS